MNKKGLIIVIAVILVAVIAWMIFGKAKPQQEVSTNAFSNVENNLDDTTNELGNVDSNDTDGDEEEKQNVQSNTNKTEEKNTSSKTNTTSNKNNKVKNTETISETATSREDRAIMLVKKEWGDTEGVSFNYTSIDSEGRYIISVNDSSSSRTLAFFKVDVDKGTVVKQ